jgi:putative PIN family toxin of toxin-antitoxin system
VEELTRVLTYPKFRLSTEDRRELLADYIPYCEVVEPTERCAAVSRDGKDQPLLDLAHSGHAEVLVTGDHDLLVLAGQTRFQIETPEAYRHRASGA